MLGCAEEVASDRVCSRFPSGLWPADQRPRAQEAAGGGGGRVGWERGLGTGSGNLLSPRSPSQFAAASPSFPFWDRAGGGVLAGAPVDVSPAPCAPLRI